MVELVKMPIPCLAQSTHLIRLLAVIQALSNRKFFGSTYSILRADLRLDAQIVLWPIIKL